MQVILVGHSAGGLCVTHAMHIFSDKIKLAIFLAATMLPSGFLSEEDILDVRKSPALKFLVTLISFL